MTLSVKRPTAFPVEVCICTHGQIPVHTFLTGHRRLRHRVCTIKGTDKTKTETAVCARALCQWSNARVPSLTPSSSHTLHFHSPFIPPPPPSPVSDLSCPSLYYTYLASVKLTYHQSPYSPLPTHPYLTPRPHLASLPSGATLHPSSV